METSTDVSAEAIRMQLERILASPGFTHSDRMARFLCFTIEQTIQGHADSLKESVLGMEVFDRTVSFALGLTPSSQTGAFCRSAAVATECNRLPL